MKNTDLVNKIAAVRVAMLTSNAERRTLQNDAESRKLAKRYVALARRIGLRYNVEMPKAFKQRLCRNCSNFLVPGVNCSVRLASVHGYVAYVCECGTERHIFYKKRAKA